MQSHRLEVVHVPPPSPPSGFLSSPDEDDLSEISKLVQQLVDESVVEVVVGAGGAERHQDGAIWRPLLGNDLFVDLVSRLRVDLQDVDVDDRHHGSEERRETSRRATFD